MIDRFDVSCNLDNLKSGRYVLYEGHLAEIAEYKKIEESLHQEIHRLDKELAEKDKTIKILEVKNRGTLANNLCPDHRDKQVGKPCLACEIEKLKERFDPVCCLCGDPLTTNELICRECGGKP